MLKYRLIFGTLMTVFFIAVVLLGGWLDGSLTTSIADDKPIQGTILCLLIALVTIPAQIELSGLIQAKNLKVFTPFSIIVTLLFATSWYWLQFVETPANICIFLLLAFSLLGMFLYQYINCGISDVIGNCGVNCFSIAYLGFLSAFILAVRIDFGLWPFLMFISVVKSSDIGAYTIGRLFGRHKLAPKISPGKTWEGMAGAVLVSSIVAVIFAINCGIMAWQLAMIFGFCFAFIGQFGDLAESMIKRDAEQKDSANNVPGFGGILDIIDSPLVAAPFAYLFFMLVC